jgi:transcriptional regulator with XRE-family HTH domain
MVKKASKLRTITPESSVGFAIRVLREAQDISQEELGFRADLHRTFVSDIERGRRNPTVRTLWKLANALQIMPSKIVMEAEKHFFSKK